MARLHSASRALLAFSLLMLAVGCSKLPRTRSFFGGDFTLGVTVEAGINQNSPVPVEVLLVYDSGLYGQLSKMTAQQWFAGRAQFLLDNPPGDGWTSEMRQWVPGETVPKLEFDYSPGINGAILFAGYFSPGAHRAIFQPFNDQLLTLQATDFVLTRVRD
ncbi:MAG TPA: hypothetical protein VGS22_10975 [Thermoanaerobaculia bacterium]|nr:hypothetical protein [Thermoanaerobaculia bacterium]